MTHFIISIEEQAHFTANGFRQAGQRFNQVVLAETKLDAACMFDLVKYANCKISNIVAD